MTNAEPVLAASFARCLPVYSDKDEDKTRYNQPGWIPVENTSQFQTIFQLHHLCPKPWRYRDAESMKTLSNVGLKDEYDGGGFVADLGYNAKSAMGVLTKLEANNWINDKTVAVFVEFTVFEPASALFSAVRYLYERFPTGGANTVTKIRTLTLYSPPDPTYGSFFQVCQLLLMLVILFFFLAEVGRLYRQKCSYFKHFWNWIEILQIISAVSTVVMFFFKEKYTSEFVKRVRENPFETSSTDYIVLWSDMEVYLLALVLFLVTLKFLRLIRFNRHVCQMTGTIKLSVEHVISFFIVFLAVILAYTQLGWLVFGASLAPYSSFYESVSSLLQMIVGGKMYFYEIRSVNFLLGPLFIFVYVLSMAMILLNMFLAILNDSYEHVKDTHGDDFPDARLGDFMSDYIQDRARHYSHMMTLYCKKLLHIPKGKRRPTIDDTESYFQVPQEELTCPSIWIEDVDEELKSVSITLASIETFNDILFDVDGRELDNIRSSFEEIGRDLRCSVSTANLSQDNESKRCCCELVEGDRCSCMEPVNTCDTEAVKIWEKSPDLLYRSRHKRGPFRNQLTCERSDKSVNNALDGSRETRV